MRAARLLWLLLALAALPGRAAPDRTDAGSAAADSAAADTAKVGMASSVVSKVSPRDSALARAMAEGYLAARPEYDQKRRALLEEYKAPQVQAEWEDKLRYAALHPDVATVIG